MPESTRLLTVQDVADRLQLNPETVRRWLRDGRLIGIDLGSDSAGWRIAEADLAAFLNERRGTRTTKKESNGE